MKRVYTSPNLLMVNHLRNMVESHGIDCLIKNEYLTGGVGQIPPTEAWPELWVADDAHADRARAIVDDALAAPAAAGPTWTCPRCGEEIEGQFTECWRCGTSRPTPDGA